MNDAGMRGDEATPRAIGDVPQRAQVRGCTARPTPGLPRESGFGKANQPGPSPPAPAELAGAGGFEPPYARAKVSCLTAWPRPTNERGFRCGPPNEMGRGESCWPRELLRGKAAGSLPGRGRGSQPRHARGWRHAGPVPRAPMADLGALRKPCGSRGGEPGTKLARGRGAREPVFSRPPAPRMSSCGSGRPWDARVPARIRPSPSPSSTYGSSR